MAEGNGKVREELPGGVAGFSVHFIVSVGEERWNLRWIEGTRRRMRGRGVGGNKV